MYAAIGVILITAGAILTFAVDKAVDGVDLDVIGWILMGGGALSLLIAAIQGAGSVRMDQRRARSALSASVSSAASATTASRST